MTNASIVQGCGGGGSDPWRDFSIPARRQETHFGDRVVPCLVDRADNLHALFEATVAKHGERLRWFMRHSAGLGVSWLNFQPVLPVDF